MVELIITEKPSAAKKIAEALADGRPKKLGGKVPYYELKHGRNKILIASAVGHLFGLALKKKKGFTYPVFDIEWQESHKGSKELDYIKQYITLLKKLSKQANTFTVACDYDVEGEVIGLNVVRYICKQKDANRMKFSTLTKDELIESYNNKSKHLDWGQANAGETRHKLDWFYGINLSRALTSSVKAAGSFKIMSIGRVQGPALKMLVDRERQIQKFKPVPYWELHMTAHKQRNIPAHHKTDKFWDKKEVSKIFAKIKKEKKATITNVSEKKFMQAPPTPFDLTTLQTESYKQFHITPKGTLGIAQTLYVAGYISYPRTSSQKLDPKLGFKKILKNLSKQKNYKKNAEELLTFKSLIPNNGKKSDPAHPALYPTGVTPKKLDDRQRKVYDLIVKRFMATFAPPAQRETVTAVLTVKNEPFIAKGTRTLTPGWHEFYAPYVKLDEVTLPALKENDQITIKKIEKIDKETSPPNRFNQSSIIRELEKRNLGTKATRADILDRLFQRGYIEGVQITASKFGIETIKALEAHTPTIVDEHLTREFEEEMKLIREGKHEQEKVLAKAKRVLIKLLKEFKVDEIKIGKKLIKAIEIQREVENTIGKCLKCKGTLKRMYSKKNKKYFIACDTYPDCELTFPLPSGALIKPTEKICTTCKHPVVLAIRKARRPQEVCIKPDCKSKKGSDITGEGETCNKCEKGSMVIRRSIYGQFLACDAFPKCRNIKK